MMNNTRPFLGPALVLSLALHAAAIAVGMQASAPREWSLRSSQAELIVRLPDASPPPRLILPEVLQRNANAVATLSTVRPRRETPGRVTVPAAPLSDSPQRLSGEAALRAAEQLQRELPYPPEAIERGLQGEALVLLFLDQAGNVAAARLESSSGHALLDDAAVRAARSLRALPGSAPREALLPVRFRLR